MLRKHLLRLKEPSEGEDKLEDADVRKSEEDIEDYVKCITFLSLFNYLLNIDSFVQFLYPKLHFDIFLIFFVQSNMQIDHFLQNLLKQRVKVVKT